MAAPTSDERREVAAKLRQMADEHDVVHAFDNADIRKLADLIDPTCYVVGTTSEEGLYGPTIFHHELSCGHTNDTGWPEPPSYCPYCGARVVDE